MTIQLLEQSTQELTLQSVFEFATDSKVKIYIPSTVDTDKAASHGLIEAVKELVKIHLSEFGGFSEYSIEGGWVSNGQLVQESITIIESVFNSKDVDREDFIRIQNLARLICLSMKQDAVMIEFSIQGKNIAVFETVA